MERYSKARIASLAMFAFVAAAPAIAQDPVDCGKTESKVSKEFAEAFNRAANAFETRDYSSAITLADLAKPLATDTPQRLWILQIQIGSYAGLKDNTRLAPALEAVLRADCLPSAVEKNYRQMLNDIRGGSTPQ